MTDRGCFGLPSTYSHTAGTCQRCVAQADCGSRVFATLQKVQGRVNVGHLISRFQMGKVAPELLTGALTLTLEQRTAVASMPKKLTGRLESLLLSGFDRVARALFAAGENPFPKTGAKDLRLAGEMLLAGGFTKPELGSQYEERFGWARSTASSQVSNAIALLRGLGLTTQVGNLTQLTAPDH